MRLPAKAISPMVSVKNPNTRNMRSKRGSPSSMNPANSCFSFIITALQNTVNEFIEKIQNFIKYMIFIIDTSLLFRKGEFIAKGV